MTSKILYMICPSDYLEPIILNRFKGHNFFYTSLGNSVVLDKGMLEQIAAITEKNSIKEITFVLSEDNKIVLDALNKQNFIQLRGLKKAYNHLLEHKKHTLNSWIIHNQHAMILSYHLNEKIKELRLGLSQYLPYLPEINGILFSKPYNSFRQIHPGFLCINSSMLN